MICSGIKIEGASCSHNNKCIYPKCINDMNKLEKMHLDAIKYEEADCMTQDGDHIKFVENHNYYDVAVKSAEITKQIAIEFANYYFRERYNENLQSELKTTDQMFQEFLKSITKN